MRDLNEMKQALIEAVVNTFGEMAFLDVIPVDGEGDFSYDEVLSIRIDRPFEGRLMVFVSDALKKAVASAILGTDEDKLKESEENDSLLELLNVLGGDFLNRLYGKSEVYTFDFPTVLVEEEIHSDCPGVLFDGESRFFRVVLCLED